MRVLGIETSCDETAAAVVADGKEFKLSMDSGMQSRLVSGQWDALGILRSNADTVAATVSKKWKPRCAPVIPKSAPEEINTSILLSAAPARMAGLFNLSPIR